MGDYVRRWGPATAASLNQPYDAVPDSHGNLFIADTENALIRKVSSDGTITTIGGNGYFSATGDAGVATSAQIGGVTGISLDSAGNLHLADSDNNFIRKLIAPQRTRRFHVLTKFAE